MVLLWPTFPPVEVSKACNVYQFAVLVLILAAIMVQVLGCQFPSYMQSTGTEPSWHIIYPEQKISAHFKEGVMSYTECDKNNKACTDYERTCYRKYGNGTFLVKQAIKSQLYTYDDYTYQCMQFLPRSRNVIQLKISKLQSFISSSLCQDTFLLLDQYPMISKELFHEKTSCPFSGGYDFQLYEPDNPSSPICDDILLPLRVESDCLDNEGLYFYFRRGHCIESYTDIGFDSVIKLHCMALWKQDGQIFSIVRRDGKTFETWCIKAKMKDNNPLEVVVSFSGGCSSSKHRHSGKTLILQDFKRHYVEGVCADEAPLCRYERKFCSTSARHKCKLTCSLCRPEDEDKPCTFPTTFHGKWERFDSSKDKFLFIGNTSFNTDLDRMNWTCVQTKNSESMRKRVLKLKFENGCYPRYICLDLQLPSISVLRYRTGTQLIWPIDSLDEVCQDRQFEFRPIDSNHELEVPASRPWQYFVRENPTFVSCALPWYIPKTMPFEMFDRLGKAIEKGCILSGVFAPSHILQVSYVQHGVVSRYNTFQCLASLKFIEEDDVLITKNQLSGDYIRWTFLVDDQRKVIIYLHEGNGLLDGPSKQTFYETPLAMIIKSENVTWCSSAKETIMQTLFVESDRKRALRPSNTASSPSVNNSSPKMMPIILHIVFLIILKFIQRFTFEV
ncbi:hypothetical protein ACJMK2_012552 [Sinanodonta woodiana]|uniref:DUF7043 domain-containing protein n=1 Tax=Sinanodonta woodiana TaxID=1069815 RepID=A0ABD3V8J1_SINWO